MRRLLVVTAGLLVACASTANTPRREQPLEASLAQNERAIRRETEPVDIELLRTHIEMLYAVGRAVEADALQGYLEGPTERGPQEVDAILARLKSCHAWERPPESHSTLARSARSRRLLTLSPVAAEYLVEANGEFSKIDVVVARSPAMAWTLIEAVMRARVDARNIEKVPTDSFPVQECIYWANGIRLEGVWRDIKLSPRGWIR